MPPAPIPPNEDERLRAIGAHAVLNGQRDDWTDQLVRAASLMTDCPIGLVTILDAERQWFKGCIGLDVAGTPREQAFCGYTILGADPLVVEDATKDERFVDNPLVTGDPKIRFYAGVPIIDEDGIALGSLCVIDHEPRTIDNEKLEGLQSLAVLVSRHISAAQRHDAIMGSALDAIVTIDESSHVIEFNQPATKIFGYTAEEAIGNSLAELIIPPALRDAHAAGMKRYLETGVGPVLGKRIEITAMRKDGTEFPVELAISPWRSGGKQCFTAFIRDITESHELNAALRLTRFTVDNARDGVMWVAPDARFVYANNAACDTLGYTPDELIEMTVFDIEANLTRNDWPTHWEQLREQGSLLIESTHRRRDGSVFPVQISCNYIEHEGKAFNCVIVRDMTDRVADETRLFESEKRFRDIAEAAGEAIWETDAESRLTYTSDQITGILGTSGADVTGVAVRDLLVGDDANRIEAIFLRAAESREPFRNIEVRYRHADEGVRWLRLSGRALHDDDGALAGFRGMALDVTEFKEAGIRRRRLMELQGIVRAVVAMFLDPEQFETAVAHLLARLSEFYEAEEAFSAFADNGIWCIQQGWRRDPERVPEDGRSAETLHAPPPAELERDRIVVRHLDDGKRRITHIGLPVFVDGQPDAYLGFNGCRRSPALFEDKVALLLSLGESMGHAIELERRRAALVRSAIQLEEALTRANEANAAKSAFLAHMSHELRTPLAAVLGYARMLREGKHEQQQTADILEKIDTNGQSLLSIINTLLDLSKIEAGALEARFEETDLLTCIRSAASAASGTAIDKGLDFEIIIGAGVPAHIRTDPLRLSQVLTNLLGNAVKYTDRGSVALRVTVTQGRLRFAVADTGPGIAPSLQDRVFEAFDRGRASGDSGGTGLGLAIAKRLTQLLGGDLSLSSTPGEGSTFTLKVPLLEPMTELLPPGPLQLLSDITPDGERAEIIRRLEGVRVLLAEDSEHVQEVVAYFLKERGALVTLCMNGQEAVDLLTESPDAVDIVLMDMQMPVLDGYNATRELRSIGISIPIVALTAHGMQHERDRCLAAGCDDYISKPVEPDALASACRRLLDRHTPAANEPANSRSATPATNTAQPDAQRDSDAHANEPASAIQRLGERFRLHLIEQASDFASELEQGTIDLDSIRKRVHKIAGAAGNLGFPEITTAARTCESAIRAGASEQDAIRSLSALIDLIRASTTRDGEAN